MALKPEVKAEARRLRIEERLSLREIAPRVGVAKATLGLWLSDVPLTEEERSEKRRSRLLGNHYRTKKRGEASHLHRMAPRNLDKPAKARIAEAAVLLRLSLVGARAFGSPFDGDKTDWVIIVPGQDRPLKIQVKWAQQGRNGLPFVSVQCASGRKATGCYKEGDFDFLVGYDLYSDRAYVWSWTEIRGVRKGKTICPEAEERWDKILGGSSSGRTPP